MKIEEAIRDVPLNMVELGLFTVNPEMVSLAAKKKLERSFVAGPDRLSAVVICQCTVWHNHFVIFSMVHSGMQNFFAFGSSCL